MINKFPVYIVSKGRFDNALTAKCFIQDGVDFKIVVEPEEYELYCKNLGEKYILKLPFSNLGLGSYPARNFCWEESIKNGHERHWVFDDNIRRFRFFHKGKKIPVNALKAIQFAENFILQFNNVAIGGFNYRYFVPKNIKQPFFFNTHVYSAMLIKNNLPFRWRLKYNEDVDLCLQVLHNKYCTVLLNAFMVDKVSTVVKMKGGNQTELYQGNKFEKKILKARSLEEIWPQYCETVIRFNRPHHFVNWKKFFTHPLIRNTEVKLPELNLKLKAVKKVKSTKLKNILSE